MKILVIGSGAREHALLWKLRQSPLVNELYCAPGNAGTGSLAVNLPVKTDDIDGLISAAVTHNIDLTVVGPEGPLIAGIVDAFEAKGLRIFGPSRAAAEIEGSKVFAKHFMQKHGIPTAEFQTFAENEFDAAAEFIRSRERKLVVKADGLAAGKGVIICHSTGEALQALDDIVRLRVFGEAGSSVVIEEFLEGEETSILALTNGTHFVTLVPSQDHKRIFDNDGGKNTGGMGAYAPVPSISFDLLEEIKRTIIKPTLEGMALEGRTYRGCLYAGLMITSSGPKVIEYNCRFGDPETEVVLPLLDDDLAQLMMDISTGTLQKTEVRLKRQTAVSIIVASRGYPDRYETGKRITGLETVQSEPDVMIFHAGTARSGDAIMTAGGRVLAVTAVGPKDDFEGTILKAYNAVDKITFDGAYYRSDIGRKGLMAQQRIHEGAGQGKGE